VCTWVVNSKMSEDEAEAMVVVVSGWKRPWRFSEARWQESGDGVGQCVLLLVTLCCIFCVFVSSKLFVGIGRIVISSAALSLLGRLIHLASA